MTKRASDNPWHEACTYVIFAKGISFDYVCVTCGKWICKSLLKRLYRDYIFAPWHKLFNNFVLLGNALLI